MAVAYEALTAAAGQFEADGDTRRMWHVRGLAAQVAAEDPELLARMWLALPHGDASGVRSDDVFSALDVDSMVGYAALELLRSRGFARQVGGWWRARDKAGPPSAMEQINGGAQ